MGFEDLCERDGFNLLVGDGSRWRQRISELNAKRAKTLPPIYIKELDLDFEIADTPFSASWVENMGLRDGRILVLRPDQHILGWLAENDSTVGLLSLLGSHVGKDVCANNPETT